MSKKSPQLRFEGFTDDWEQRKLKEITSLITKGTTPKDKSGRIKNKIKFTDIWLYKICEEWFNDRKIRYVYSIPIKEEQGLTIHLDELETRNISLVAKRDKQNVMKYIYEKKYD